jgi:hypothetical protein
VLKKLHRSATATQGRQTHGQAILQERCHEATMAAQGRFISKLSEKGLPFFKLLKNADKFVWDEEAHQAFEALKEFLTSLPIMTTPVPKKTLLLYILATTNVVNTVLVAEREEEG